MRVREIMTSPAVVLAPELAVKRAAAVLALHGFTGAPVVDGAGHLVGVVNEQDLLADRFPPDPRTPILERPARPVADAVSDVMQRHVFVADPQESVADLVAVLRSADVRSVPVVENDVVVGVVTYRDLVRALARDDVLIEADVRRRLDIFGGIGQWGVTVRDGAVTLTDDHDDPADRGVAMRVAESVIGVTRCTVVSRQPC
ncbi:HPP family protein [Pseudonocardia sp. GCM10023141]|uniref:CBS domain-containing protein n=1 Tax=Pseudonocardia sp. GCM10023141 TaxID=3252653 RepID=UPI003608134C